MYIFGPQPAIICHFEMLLRGSITIQQLLLSDILMIARYLFLFHVKNPTSNQHDFWAIFFSIWSFSIGMISTGVFMFMPGRNPNYFYICLGKIPSNHQNETTKVNIVLNFLLCITTLVHVVLGSKIKIHEKNHTNGIIIPSNQMSNLYNLYTVTSHLLALACYGMFYFWQIVSLAQDPKSFENYPNYLLIYIFHLYSTQTFAIAVLLLMFKKNKPLFKYVKRRVFSLFNVQWKYKKVFRLNGISHEHKSAFTNTISRTVFIIS